MPPTLAQTLALLTSLDEEDRDRNLEAAIKADDDARVAGFRLSLVAPGQVELDRLGLRLGRQAPDVPVRRLPPFQDVVEWTEDDLATLHRSPALLAMTTARQLVPHRLAQVMVEAERADMPMSLLVAELDRVRDPRSLAARAEEEVKRAAPGLTLRLVALGGARLAGPSLDEATAGEVEWVRSGWAELVQRRERVLSRARVLQARAHCHDRRAALSAQHRDLEERSLVLSQGRLGGEIVGQSEATLWSDRLRSAAEAIRDLPADALARQVLAESRSTGRPLVELMEAAVLEAVREQLGDWRGRTSSELRSRLRELRTSLVRSRHRHLDDTTGAPVEDAIPPLMADVVGQVERSLDATFEAVERRAAEALRVSSRILEILASTDLFDLVSPSRSGPGDVDVADAKRPAAESTRQALHRNVTTRITRTIQARLVATHVTAEISRMLTEAERQVYAEQERVRQEWTGLLMRMGQAVFKDLKDEAERERQAVAGRLGGLQRVLEELHG